MKGVDIGPKKRMGGPDVGGTERQEQLIRRAAKTRGVSVTDFILESACQQAEHALADKREFIVSPKRWQAFLEVLDGPAHVNPKVAQLFSNSVVLAQEAQK